MIEQTWTQRWTVESAYVAIGVVGQVCTQRLFILEPKYRVGQLLTHKLLIGLANFPVGQFKTHFFDVESP